MRTLVALILVFAGTVGVFPQEKYALVIGNANYISFGSLRNTLNDANDMEAVLKDNGWTVEKILNGNLEAMENAGYAAEKPFDRVSAGGLRVFVLFGSWGSVEWRELSDTRGCEYRQ
jgi:hypothetical protein